MAISFRSAIYGIFMETGKFRLTQNKNTVIMSV